MSRVVKLRRSGMLFSPDALFRPCNKSNRNPCLGSPIALNFSNDRSSSDTSTCVSAPTASLKTESANLSSFASCLNKPPPVLLNHHDSKIPAIKHPRTINAIQRAVFTSRSRNGFVLLVSASSTFFSGSAFLERYSPLVRCHRRSALALNFSPCSLFGGVIDSPLFSPSTGEGDVCASAELNTPTIKTSAKNSLIETPPDRPVHQDTPSSWSEH